MYMHMYYYKYIIYCEVFPVKSYRSWNSCSGIAGPTMFFYYSMVFVQGVYMYVHVHIHVDWHLWWFNWPDLPLCTHVHAMYTCIHTCTCIYICTYKCTCIHFHIVHVRTCTQYYLHVQLLFEFIHERVPVPCKCTSHVHVPCKCTRPTQGSTFLKRSLPWDVFVMYSTCCGLGRWPWPSGVCMGMGMWPWPSCVCSDMGMKNMFVLALHMYMYIGIFTCTFHRLRLWSWQRRVYRST